MAGEMQQGPKWSTIRNGTSVHDLESAVEALRVVRVAHRGVRRDPRLTTHQRRGRGIRTSLGHRLAGRHGQLPQIVMRAPRGQEVPTPQPDQVWTSMRVTGTEKDIAVGESGQPRFQPVAVLAHDAEVVDAHDRKAAIASLEDHGADLQRRSDARARARQ